MASCQGISNLCASTTSRVSASTLSGGVRAIPQHIPAASVSHLRSRVLALRGSPAPAHSGAPSTQAACKTQTWRKRSPREPLKPMQCAGVPDGLLRGLAALATASEAKQVGEGGNPSREMTNARPTSSAETTRRSSARRRGSSGSDRSSVLSGHAGTSTRERIHPSQKMTAQLKPPRLAARVPRAAPPASPAYVLPLITPR
jgi:hypothetical protein